MTLFEASHRVGGKILTPAFGLIPATYEAGAAEFYDYSGHDDDPLKELVAELGLPIARMEGTSAVARGRTIANLDDLQDQFGRPAVDDLLAFDRRAKDAITPHEFYEADPEGVGDPVQQRQLVQSLSEEVQSGRGSQHCLWDMPSLDVEVP